MAKDKIQKFIDASDDAIALEDEKSTEVATETFVPQYRVVSEDKILVSKKMGSIWKSRMKSAQDKLKQDGTIDRWDENIRYYRNDHEPKGERNNNNSNRRNVNLATTGIETENIVFANTTALVPALYAKNPVVEITVEDNTLVDWADCHERLINALFAKRHRPGVNIKQKARKAIVCATLCNVAYMEVGYIKKEEANETVLEEINKLSDQYAKEKDAKKIKEIEAKLSALEEKVDILSPSGPFVKYRTPYEILRDPDATCFEDCKWIMIKDFESTERLKVMYGKKKDNGEYDSVYEPTHVMKPNVEDSGSDMVSLKEFSMLNLDDKKGHKEYGYDDEHSYAKAQRTLVWYIWDKITRRVFLYSSVDWTWPLWVWEDPYGFPDFFPIEMVEFYTDPIDIDSKSEVSMYLDQQDAINDINMELHKTRKMLAGKFIYNSAINGASQVVEALLSGTADKRVAGIELPADFDINKFIIPLKPASSEALNTIVFDKQRLLEAIDRVSSVTSVMRGVEYKTNTTNKAIESYESTTQTRLDEKIDAIEDFLGRVGEKLGYLAMKNFDEQDAANLLGIEKAKIWMQNTPDPDKLIALMSIRIVGGSTLKPTSHVKKQQAIQISQALGQFANASPATIIVMLKVLERAFDEFVIKKEDWQMITDSLMQQQQSEQAQPQSSQQNTTPEGAPNEEMLVQIEQMIDQLPEEVKMAFGQLIAKGMPFKQAVATIMEQMKGQENEGQPQAN